MTVVIATVVRAGTAAVTSRAEDSRPPSSVIVCVAPVSVTVRLQSQRRRIRPADAPVDLRDAGDVDEGQGYVVRVVARGC